MTDQTQIPQEAQAAIAAAQGAANAPQGEQQQVSITLGDVASVVQLIDVVSRRGAISGQELAGVGMLRNKLETFLAQNGALSEQGAFKGEEAQNDAGVQTDAPQGELAGMVRN